MSFDPLDFYEDSGPNKQLDIGIDQFVRTDWLWTRLKLLLKAKKCNEEITEIIKKIRETQGEWFELNKKN